MAPFKLSEEQKRFVFGGSTALLIQAGYAMKKKKGKKRRWWVCPGISVGTFLLAWGILFDSHFVLFFTKQPLYSTKLSLFCSPSKSSEMA